MLRNINHDDRNRQPNDENQESEDVTLNEEFTSTVFKEETKFVRSTRKPNVHVAKSTFRYSKQGTCEPKKSIYDPVSSSDEDVKEVDKVNHIAEERSKNLPKGRGYVVQKFEKLRKVGDDMDEITNDIRQIYPLGHSEDMIVAKLKNSSPENHMPKKKHNNHRLRPVLSNQKQQQSLEEDNSTSTSSSYGPYVPSYEQKPNLSDGNEFPSLSLGKKQKHHVRKDNATTSSGASYNRKFRPTKKLNLKDVTEFPNL